MGNQFGHDRRRREYHDYPEGPDSPRRHASQDDRATDPYRGYEHDRFDREHHEALHAVEDLKRGARRLFRALKGYTRPDERIREDVCDRINEVGRLADADLSDLEVRVQNGEVTLAGSLRDRRQKHLLENAAEAVGGVKDVHDLVRIRRDDEHPDLGQRAESGTQAARGVTSTRPGSA
jgi:hypothetical protein